jgi:hypothetical protein
MFKYSILAQDDKCLNVNCIHLLDTTQAELGMMGINTPSEYGGSELDALSYAIAMVSLETLTTILHKILCVCIYIYNMKLSTQRSCSTLYIISLCIQFFPWTNRKRFREAVPVLESS